MDFLDYFNENQDSLSGMYGEFYLNIFLRYIYLKIFLNLGEEELELFICCLMFVEYC